jgi:hypothetical protein
MSRRARPKSVDEAVAHETRIFSRKIRLLEDSEFVESNAEAVAAYEAGERGISLEEFRQKHPYPRP